MLEKIIIKGPGGSVPEPSGITPTPLSSAIASAAQEAAVARQKDVAVSVPAEGATDALEAAQDVPSGPRIRFVEATEVHDLVVAEIEKDETYTRLELPSNFVFYPWKTIGIKPLKGIHQAKIAAAARQTSTRLLVECVNTLLPKNINAFDLTTADFQWLLYWMRQHFYTRTPLTVRVVCGNPKHHQDVQLNKVSKKSLVNIADIDKSILAESGLEKDKLIATLSLIDNIEAVPITHDTIGGTCDLMDLTTSLYASVADDPSKYDDAAAEATLKGEIGSVALLLDVRDEQGNLAPIEERIKAAESLPVDDYVALEQAAWHMVNYGIKETARVTCKECGAEIRETIRIKAQDFLPDRSPVVG